MQTQGQVLISAPLAGLTASVHEVLISNKNTHMPPRVSTQTDLILEALPRIPGWLSTPVVHATLI